MTDFVIPNSAFGTNFILSGSTAIADPSWAWGRNKMRLLMSTHLNDNFVATADANQRAGRDVSRAVGAALRTAGNSAAGCAVKVRAYLANMGDRVRNSCLPSVRFNPSRLAFYGSAVLLASGIVALALCTYDCGALARALW